MDKMNQLKDLLTHEIHDLYSAEEQILKALPAMIEKAKDRKLKKALQDHLKTTESQKQRLDKLLPILEDASSKKGLFSGLFGSKKCKGMQGLIDEGEKVMGEKMDPDVMDAAIVGCAQKIEHYEICGYGTTRAYAEELGLNEIEKVLRTTLDEEYAADDLLTVLAVGRLNKEAIPQTNRTATSRKISGNGTTRGSKLNGRPKPVKKKNTVSPSYKKSITR